MIPTRAAMVVVDCVGFCGGCVPRKKKAPPVDKFKGPSRRPPQTETDRRERGINSECPCRGIGRERKEVRECVCV